MAKKVSIAICTLLLVYFLFTSGLVFEAVGSEDVGRVDTPYSIALSGERTGILEMYTDGDADCARWLARSKTSRTSAVLFMHVLIDPPMWHWEGQPEEEIWVGWWNNDVVHNIDNKVLPLLDWARQSGLAIVFTSEGGIEELATELEIGRHDDPVINDCAELDAYLKERGITTIYYAGYATNICVLEWSTGMRMMHSLGYETVLVEDCSLAIPAYAYTGEMALGEIRGSLDGTIPSATLRSIINEDLPIFTDYNGVNILVEYSDEYGRMVQHQPDGGHYLFLTSWNTRHGRMVGWAGSNLRGYLPLPDLTDAVELYRKGDSVVYFIGG
jgi:hypothetical protein